MIQTSTAGTMLFLSVVFFFGGLVIAISGLAMARSGKRSMKTAESIRANAGEILQAAEKQSKEVKKDIDLILHLYIERKRKSKREEPKA